MDEVKITSRFVKNIVASILSKKISKSIGSDISLGLRELTATVDENGNAHIHLDIEAGMFKDDLIRLLMKNKLM